MLPVFCLFAKTLTSATGMSNSSAVRHWSAFNFPCSAQPKFSGRAACQEGRVVDLITSLISLSTFLVIKGDISKGLVGRQADGESQDAAFLRAILGISSFLSV